MAHSGAACKIMALHPKNAGCLTLLGLGLLFCHCLWAGLLTRGKTAAGEEMECLQPHPFLCVPSTGEMGGEGGRKKGNCRYQLQDVPSHWMHARSDQRVRLSLSTWNFRVESEDNALLSFIFDSAIFKLCPSPAKLKAGILTKCLGLKEIKVF